MISILDVLRNNPHFFQYLHRFHHEEHHYTHDPYSNYWKEVDPLINQVNQFPYSAMQNLPAWIKDIDDLENDMLDGGIYILEIPYCGYSDYSGSMVERSNYKAIEEAYDGLDGLYFFYGDYDSNTLAFDLRAFAFEVDDTINGLEGYPCIDESLLSEMEMEQQGEDWESYGRGDFKDSLGKEFKDWLDETQDIHEWYHGYLWDFDSVDDEKLDKLYYSIQDTGNHYPEIEEGGSSWFYPNQCSKEVTLDQIKALTGYDRFPMKAYHGNAHIGLCEDLLHIVLVSPCIRERTLKGDIIRLIGDVLMSRNEDSRQTLIDLLKT